MIKILDLCKTHRSKNRKTIKALDKVSVDLPDKGFVFLLGKSGSGKSTLLNIIDGLDSATSGNVNVDGNDLFALKETDFCSYRNTYIGFVFQDYQLINELTVYQNVALALKIMNAADNGRVEKALERVGLIGYEERYPDELSGGEKQRVAIARAIVKNPRIILADEPTGNLDTDTAESIIELLKSLSQDRLVFVVSHNKNFAESYADRIIELSEGKIVSDRLKNTQPITEQCEKVKSPDIKKQKFSFKNQIKLSGSFLRKKSVALILSSFMVAVVMVIMAFAQTIINFDSGEIIKKEMENSGSDSIYITKTLSEEQKTHIDTLEVNINPFPEIYESDIKMFRDADYEDEIYEVYKYGINIEKSSVSAGMTTSVLADSPYILETLGTIVVDRSFLEEKYGEVKYLAKAKEFHPTGVVITDYVADAIILCDRVAYADSYDSLIGEYKWGTIGSSNCVSRGYINGIIYTGYKEKYSDVFKRVVTGKITDKNELFKDEDFLRFVNDVYSGLGFCYSLNPDFAVDAISNPAWETVWHYALQFDDKDLFTSSIPQVRSAKFYDIQLGENEVLMEVTSYNKVFGTEYDESNISNFQPHSVKMSHYKYFDANKEKPLFTSDVKIVGLFVADKTQKEGTFIAGDTIYKAFAKDFIYTAGLYFDGNENIDCIIDVATKSGYQKNSATIEAVGTMTKAVEVFVPIFRLIAVVLCVGVIFILTRFLFKTINDKMHDIGILKALGIKNGAVAVIFGVQAILIAALTIILSTIGYGVFVEKANEILVESLMTLAPDRLVLNLDFITFNTSVALQNGIMVVVLAAVSLIIPIIKIYRAQPVKIIRTEK